MKFREALSIKLPLRIIHLEGKRNLRDVIFYHLTVQLSSRGESCPVFSFFFFLNVAILLVS